MSGFNVFDDLRAFHHKFGVASPQTPCVPNEPIAALRGTLIDEEVNKELLPAIEELRQAKLDNDPQAVFAALMRVADGCIDAIYVIGGTLISLGLPAEELWHEVHRTNMAKTGGGLRGDGKIMKPEGWVPPDIRRIIEEAMVRDARIVRAALNYVDAVDEAKGRSASRCSATHAKLLSTVRQMRNHT